jgi:manganese-dependent inorganic pyrophosphatase
MLLGAIVSDTVQLTSPTTTERDGIAATYLEELLGVGAVTFGREMFEQSSDVSRISAVDLVSRDLKEYELDGNRTLSVAQIESVGHAVHERRAELLAAAEAHRERSGHVLFALMLTDILARDTLVHPTAGHPERESGVGRQAVVGRVELPGVLIRKKQVAPGLLAAAAEG